jgi:hypothetical protein
VDPFLTAAAEPGRARAAEPAPAAGRRPLLRLPRFRE